MFIKGNLAISDKSLFFAVFLVLFLFILNQKYLKNTIFWAWNGQRSKKLLSKFCTYQLFVFILWNIDKMTITSLNLSLNKQYKELNCLLGSWYLVKSSEYLILQLRKVSFILTATSTLLLFLDKLLKYWRQANPLVTSSALKISISTKKIWWVHWAFNTIYKIWIKNDRHRWLENCQDPRPSYNNCIWHHGQKKV